MTTTLTKLCANCIEAMPVETKFQALTMNGAPVSIGGQCAECKQWARVAFLKVERVLPAAIHK